MSTQSWVIRQLREDDRPAEPLGDHGIRVPRTDRPDAIAYCSTPDEADPFTITHLHQATQELPEAKMVIVFLGRQRVEHEVYEHAPQLHVCVDTFGGFINAIEDLNDISQYMSGDERYLRRRLTSTRAVTSITRKGHRAWKIERANNLRPLVIVTHDRYELTDDEFATIINQYPTLTPDALVVTNPAAQGFGSRVSDSATNAEVPIFTLREFLAEIRNPWT